MKAMTLSAGVLAAALGMAVTAVSAADLDYDDVPPRDRFGSAYEDPRYRDLYAPTPPRAYTYAPRPYEPAPHPVPPGYVYRDRAPERSGWADRDEGAVAHGCLPHREIHRRLVEDGWHDFHDLEMRRNSALVNARRPNGDTFALKVDRCNGEVLRTDLIGRGGIGPYANRGDRWRSGRPYY